MLRDVYDEISYIIQQSYRLYHPFSSESEGKKALSVNSTNKKGSKNGKQRETKIAPRTNRRY